MDTCFDMFGAKGVRSGFFVVMLNMSGEQEQAFKSQLTTGTEFTEIALTDHQQYSDISGIINHFKIEEQELSQKNNGFLNSVYCKLALKRI